MYKYMSRDGMTYQFIGLNIFISNLQYGWNDFVYKQPVYETVTYYVDGNTQ